MGKLVKYLNVAWTYFNEWRKRYWLTRTIIILLLCSTFLYEKIGGHLIICDLVKIACEAIFYGSIPQCEDATCKYYKAVEIKRLQTSIIFLADKNRNGILDADEIEFLKSKGCDTDEIQKLAFRADMDRLAEDAGRLGLLPPSYSTKQIRKNAFNAAHGEIEFTFKPLTDDVFDIIERTNWPCPKYTEKQLNELNSHYTEEELRTNPVVTDYRTWATWKNGLLNLAYCIFIDFGPLISTSLWFLISIMLGLLSAITFKRHEKIMAISVSLLFLAIVLFFNKGNHWTSVMSSSAYIYIFFALAMFSIIAGLTGFRISKYVEDKRRWRIWILLIIGFMMMLWSFNLDFMLYGSFYYGYIFCGYGIGRLVSPATGEPFSAVDVVYSQNPLTISVIIILVSLFFLYRYYTKDKAEDIQKDRR